MKIVIKFIKLGFSSLFINRFDWLALFAIYAFELNKSDNWSDYW